MQCSAAHNDDGVLITAQQISSAKNGKNGHHRHPAPGHGAVHRRFLLVCYPHVCRSVAERTLLIFAQIFADLSRVFAVFRVRDERGGESLKIE